MKNFTKIVTAGAIIGTMSVAATTANAASNRSLEKRIAKIEKKLKANKGNFLASGNQTIFGRLQFDKTFTDGRTGDQNNDGDLADAGENVKLKDDSDLRRGRIGVKGNLAGDWGYKFEADFASTGTKVTDAFISKKLGNAKLRIGQNKEPFSLEELTSSRFITFNERAGAVNAYVPGRKLGISYNLHLDGLNFATGIYGDAINDSNTTAGEREDSAITSRLAHYTSLGGKDVLHLGVAYRVAEPSGNSTSAYEFTADVYERSNTPNVATIALIGDVSKVRQTGLELAVVKGKASVQAEYVHTNLEGTNADNLEGYYGQVSLFLTDDQRNYQKKSSTFGRVKPNGDNGAVEVAYRYDEARNVGAKNHTVGVNWYATDNVRLSANYVRADINASKTGNITDNSDTSKDGTITQNYADDADIIALRAQVDF